MSGPDEHRLAQLLEEILERQRRGLPVEGGNLLEQSPEHAEELRGFLADSEFLKPLFTEARTPSRLGSNHGVIESLSPLETPDENHPSLFPELAGFRILEELGSGGQGVVYKAIQPGTQRLVALKVIRDGVFASFKERLRFENEIRLSATLKHPNIVSIHGSGSERGRAFFFMEYADGEPLDLFLSNRTLTIRETAELFLSICDAVRFAHQQGVIHRDLKPANVLVDREGSPHILDFGLAKLVNGADEPGITQIGSFAGTWYYAAPEQVRGQNNRADIRSDVYSLGVMLYEAITDAFPYPIGGATSDRIAQQILTVEPIRPSLIRRDVGDELETIILRALQKEPDRRYSSAEALHEDLRRLLAGEPIEAKRDSPLYVLRKTLRYYRKWVAAAAAGFVLLVAFGVTISILYMDARAARATSEARAEFGRRGVSFLLNRTDEMNALRSVVAHVESQQPNHAAIQRFARSFRPLVIDEITAVVRSTPFDLLDLHRGRTDSDARADHDWFVQNALGIEALRAYSESSRITFATEPTESVWVTSDHDTSSFPAKQLCALLARAALTLATSSEIAEGGRYLDAARLVALDLADGATFVHWGASLECRQDTFVVILASLEESWENPALVTRWRDWLERDPPLPTLRDTVAVETMKVFQLIEASIRETRPDGSGHIDLRLLDQLTDGLLSNTGAITPREVATAASVSPVAALAALDRFGQEFRMRSAEREPKDPSGDDAHEPTQGDDLASRVMRPLLPSFDDGLWFRRKVVAWRIAARTAVELIAMRAERGAWPCVAQPADLCDVQEFAPYLAGEPRLTFAIVSNAPEIALQPPQTGTRSQPQETQQPTRAETLFRPRSTE